MSCHLSAPRWNCALQHGLISWGIYAMRQLPSPSAAAWLFDLGDLRGPWILVLRDREDEARQRLAEHLVDVGQASDVAEAMAVLADVPIDHAAVIW
jgi:hypothetical protein